MTERKRRITGTEMEWSPWIRQTPDTPLVPCPEGLPNMLLQHHLSDKIIRDPRSGMSTNGARIYQDLGRFVEYATPEDTSYWSTVANEIAGERVVLDMLERAKLEGKFADYILNKRVMSDDGNTWGYHTSFSCDSKKMSISQQSLETIGMHLATQNIYAGAGAIWRQPGKPASYALAQKVCNLTCDYALHTHGNDQPLVSMRDEPLADPESLLRLHLTSMDANISPWATWMRLGTTSLVLTLLENGYRGSDIAIQPGTMHLFAKQVARDTNLNSLVPLKSGKEVRALDIQRSLLEHAEKLDLDDQDQEVATEWRRALNDLEADPELLRDRADWVIRRAVIERALDKLNHDLDAATPEVTLDSHSIAIRDRGYDLLKDDVGIGSILRRRGTLAKWMPPEGTIELAMETPPETTRAKIRSELIRKYHTDDNLNSRWNFVGTNRDSQKHWLKNPWSTRIEEDDAA